MMGRITLYTALLVFSAAGLRAQNASKMMREGVLAYKKGEFAEAISKFGGAEAKGADKNLANYNMGAAYYKAGKADSALNYWQSVAINDKDKSLQARAWHNIGNSFVKQQNYEKAADAYKQALKLSPDDEDTRYNLAYSQRRVEQQQKQQQQQQNQPKPEEKQQEKPKPEDENLNKNEADRILKALDNKEQDLHKGKKTDGNPTAPLKDW